MTKYVLLMRHGRHEAAEQSYPWPRQRKLSREGEQDTRAVAERLASVLQELKTEDDLVISIGEFWIASSDEVVATATVVKEVLKDQLQCPPKLVKDLNPAVFKPYTNAEKKNESLASKIEKFFNDNSEQNAILIIGHQPFLGWLCHTFLGKAIPQAPSELLCITINSIPLHPFYRHARGTLRWVLSPKDDAAMAEIKEKIKSKMDIAKLLSVFITTALGFLLGSFIDKAKVEYISNYIWALHVSAVMFFVSIVLYLATMYAYDRLLMPTRFWGEAPPPKKPQQRPHWLVWRPPSSAVWVLYQNMMRIWKYLFGAATLTVLLGLFFLSVAVFKPTVSLIIFIPAIGLGLLLFWYYYRIFGPNLGSED